MDLSAFTPAQRRAGALALLLVVALVLVLPHLRRHAPAKVVPPLRPATHSRAAAAAAEPELVVDVAGAVRRPGLYHLAQGTRIADAVAAAGGATAKAEVAAVNLAAPLADGEQVLVPARGVGAAAGAGAGGPSPAAPVDLNSATAEQLDTLPGIGPSTAQKIIAFRQEHGPFHSVDELDAVPGIGPSRIDELKGLVLP